MAHFPGKIHCNLKQNRLQHKLQVKCDVKQAAVDDERCTNNCLRKRIEHGLKTFYYLFKQDDDEKSFDGFSLEFIRQRRNELLNGNCETKDDKQEELNNEDECFNCRESDELNEAVVAKEDVIEEQTRQQSGDENHSRVNQRSNSVVARKDYSETRDECKVDDNKVSPKQVTERKLNDGPVFEITSDNSMSSCESLSSRVSSANSAIRKEAIKRNMVSRYTEIMMSDTTNGFAEKAGESEKSNEKTKLASKIERLLKSQWEERLKKKELEDDCKRSSSPTVTGAAAAAAATTPTTQEPIIRKAKLQLNNKTLLKLRQPSSLKHLIFDEPKSNSVANECDTPLNSSTRNNRNNNGGNNSSSNDNNNSNNVNNNKKRTSNGGRPGFITCAICNITKYYSHVQRRHGQYSCEPCSKFFARFCRNPKQFYCSKNGDCPISVNQVPISTPNKCRACWLKLCLQKFIIDPSVRAHISSNFAPKLESSPNVSLITVDTSHGNSFSPSIAKESSSLLMLATGKQQQQQQRQQSSSDSCRKRTEFRAKNGPRVKRVCRSVDVIKGLPRATFSSFDETKKRVNNEEHSEASDREEEVDSDNDSDDLPIDVYLCRAYEKEMRKSDADSGFDINTGVVNGIRNSCN